MHKKKELPNKRKSLFVWVYLINRKAFLSDIPFPISDLRHIKTILSNILLVFNKLVLHELVGCRGRQPLHLNKLTNKYHAEACKAGKCRNYDKAFFLECKHAGCYKSCYGSRKVSR